MQTVLPKRDFLQDYLVFKQDCVTTLSTEWAEDGDVQLGNKKQLPFKSPEE